MGERPHLWMFSFGSARNCRSKSFPTSPKGRRGPGPCAGTHTVRPPSVRMRPDAGIGPCGVRASPCLCVGGGACPRPPVPGLRCAAGVISRPARAIESLWRKNAPSSVTASPCHLPPREGLRLPPVRGGHRLLLERKAYSLDPAFPPPDGGITPGERLRGPARAVNFSSIHHQMTSSTS